MKPRLMICRGCSRFDIMVNSTKQEFRIPRYLLCRNEPRHEILNRGALVMDHDSFHVPENCPYRLEHVIT